MGKLLKMLCATLNTAKSTTEGQDGGICIGTGTSKANQVSYNGRVYKKGDPDYDEMRKKALSELERFK